MAYWAQTDATGCVLHLTNIEPAPEGYVLWPRLDPSQAGLWRWTGIDWEPRPTTSEPAVTDGDTLQLAWSDLPVGTRWEVADVIAGYLIAEGVVDSEPLAFEFEEAGHYRIELSPPHPYRPAILQVQK